MHPNPQAARDLTRAISDAAPIRDEQLAGPVLEGLLAENLRAYAGTIEPDPAGLFNSSLEGNTRRAIDFHQGDTIDERAFVALVRAAVELSES